ncbi:hypothetical protein OZX57_08070 [Bifidobacterium sp. ESL0682]|uniref:hypothetical protein n=1 Tax=Bifidobacterium sp. ESL0682 TaxID=2983212 RepID=UPI0023F9EE1D|nr:hypothetical protein [Bifidobacterium sp. ESL0682]WEV41878.1 hypothetical protein OZX57_08070 [Bifidobacterium sp. ESL0682]
MEIENESEGNVMAQSDSGAINKKHRVSERMLSVRVPEKLNQWLRCGADAESIKPSVLIRKAIGEYLELHHGRFEEIAEIMSGCSQSSMRTSSVTD